MIRRFFFALFFGTLIGLIASQASGQAAGLAAGLFSGLAFVVASALLRSRVLRRQGEAPAMQPGEKPVLHGPCEVSDKQGSAKAWAYLSNQRLILKDEDGGPALGMELADISELRPEKGGVTVVSKEHGALRLSLPDPKRWLKALQEAARI